MRTLAAYWMLLPFALGCGGMPTPASTGAQPSRRGSGDRPARAVEAPEIPVEIRVAAERSCVRTRGGDLICWGGDPRRPTRVAREVAELLFVGRTSLCYRLEGGELECPMGPPDLVALDGAEGRFLCAVREDRSVACRTGPEAAFEAVRGVESASAIGVGVGFACAIDDGVVRCWGRNEFGQLGRPGRRDSDEAVAVEGLPDTVVGLAVGPVTACALSDEGEVLCWGSGSDGGVANEEFVVGGLSARPVPDLREVRRLSHRCAVSLSGEVLCWGRWRSREMLPCDHPVRAQHPNAVLPIVGLPSMRTVASSDSHACGISEDDSVFCWGANGAGQLGDGTSQEHPAPRRVWPLTWDEPLSCATADLLREGRIVDVRQEPSRDVVELCLESAGRACFRYDLGDHRVTTISAPSAPPWTASEPPAAWVVRRTGALLSVCPREGTACHELAPPRGFVRAFEAHGEVGRDGAIVRPSARVTDDGAWLALLWTDPELDEQGRATHHLSVHDLERGRTVEEVESVGVPESVGSLAVRGRVFLYGLTPRTVATYAPDYDRAQRVAHNRAIDLTRVYPLPSGRTLYLPPDGRNAFVIAADGTLFAQHGIEGRPEVPPLVISLRSGGRALLYSGGRDDAGGRVVLLHPETGAPVHVLSPPRCSPPLEAAPSCGR